MLSTSERAGLAGSFHSLLLQRALAPWSFSVFYMLICLSNLKSKRKRDGYNLRKSFLEEDKTLSEPDLFLVCTRPCDLVKSTYIWQQSNRTAQWLQFNPRFYHKATSRAPGLYTERNVYRRCMYTHVRTSRQKWLLGGCTEHPCQGKRTSKMAKVWKGKYKILFACNMIAFIEEWKRIIRWNVKSKVIELWIR